MQRATAAISNVFREGKPIAFQCSARQSIPVCRFPSRRGGHRIVGLDCSELMGRVPHPTPGCPPPPPRGQALRRHDGRVCLPLQSHRRLYLTHEQSVVVIPAPEPESRVGRSASMASLLPTPSRLLNVASNGVRGLAQGRKRHAVEVEASAPGLSRSSGRQCFRSPPMPHLDVRQGFRMRAPLPRHGPAHQD